MPDKEQRLAKNLIKKQKSTSVTGCLGSDKYKINRIFQQIVGKTNRLYIYYLGQTGCNGYFFLSK